MWGTILWGLTVPQSMLHQENQAMIINTGSKQGITNPPCVQHSDMFMP